MKKTEIINKWREFEARVELLVPKMEKIDNRIEKIGAILKNEEISNQEAESLEFRVKDLEEKVKRVHL